ncbi:bifunctional homocysteine S-methyltransferase/methylenetetrahydrofolate reductase [Geobacter sp. SVR]|uniref:bifunctional homocysteine S-methyltransferase/methylenetetrahydrofolate reductase n=1 Tax=Geobacter sp. SVR TaxID=2495594 RepID=UPI00143EF83B|nr:bifunctional homocysteine S-methyltransferase/methylenetetrahydrofolate reductase [Geobacter sp. SVR]BCS51754.1 bifunctional homocysteine S-methyltransferase/methylenetetrahydrofolate reductase [Geobacter sp. SVR]GCF84941.1 bifunctional homocysteine S-methyltransferase/methylenetetrahydrofolate reductase [Geobacter sp. SVR]
MNVIDRLKTEILTGDGAVGTMLYAKGVSLDSNFEHLNLVRPALVQELADEYVAVGAQVIETNTFGANWTKLSAIGLGHKVADINAAGVRIARQAARQGRDVLVAGSVGPLSRGKGDERELESDEMREIFRCQCQALATEGIDLFMLETFSSLKQLMAAIQAAGETGLPVCASMAFLEGGRSGDGTTVEQFSQSMETAGTDIIGANCGAGPLELANVVRRLAALSTRPIAAYANSGFPEYREGRYIYRATPDYFAAMAVEMAEAGATLIGGCCGTTPEHIAAVSRALKTHRPVPRPQPQLTDVMETGRTIQTGAASFLDEWGRRKIITVELDPPKGMDCSRIIEGSRRLKQAGVDAINLAENPLARPRMGNIALGSLIQQQVGIEVIVHITGRDRNLIGMQSDLMGASLMGIRSILAVTGDPATMGDHAGAKSVFDLHSFTLIKLLSDLNRGVNAIGNPIGRGTGFTIGAAFNPNTSNTLVQVERLQKKVANGAVFAQTQPVYDPAVFLDALHLTHACNIPVLPGIMPLVSERNAAFLHNEVPGISIPDPVLARMKGLEKEAGVREGLAIAREFIDATFEAVGGYYLIPPFGKVELALELVEYIHTRERKSI